MDYTTTTPPPAAPAPVISYRLSFHGKGGDFFGIVVVNWLLTAITLGLYYPWAKARTLQFLYGATEFNDSRFSFHGTGAEMFKGFLKAILVFAVLFGVFGLFIWLSMPLIGVLLLYAGILAIVPLAIHGSYKYRMSRTSWRGIRFGYRGDRSELVTNFFKWILLTFITLGIYGAWMAMKLRNYVLSRVRFGNLQFSYRGLGGDYLWLNIKGYFLTLITLGIYGAWWFKELFDYYVNNLTLHDGARIVQFRSTAKGSEIFVLLLVNILLLVITLGLGYAWVVTRTMDYIFSHIEMNGDIDINTIAQTETIYTDATGEDLGDMLDFGFVI
jgi:uncharacterized membrane protein YjgN (DUF898 family)